MRLPSTLLATLLLTACASAPNDLDSAGAGLAHLGDQMVQKGEKAAALDFYQKALERDPQNVPAHKGLAALLLEMGDDAGAGEHYRTLAALRPRFAMGIVTSSRSDHFTTIHRRTGLLEFFDFVLTSEDYAESKPAPDPYLAGIARTGCAPAECLAIEDAPRGLAAARAAGIDCWVIPTDLSRPADFSAAARILNNVHDVAELLR